MKPAVTDPFPRKIEIIRARRRSLEVRLESGRFVGRIPMRIKEAEALPVLDELRAKLWHRLQKESVFDDAGLEARARRVVRDHLSDQRLPPFSVRFSRRQNKRWGSCTFDGKRGAIRVSAHLVGHPTWLIDEVLLHEIVHLLHHDHGPAFSSLVERSPNHDRAKGYLEALSHVERTGPSVTQTLRDGLDAEEPQCEQAGLFESHDR